jgi:cytochrome c biogenesis protein CcdA
MTGIDMPTLGVVTASAAIDSLSPCAIGVLILMISVVLGGKDSVRRLAVLGSFYISAIFITYLLAGLGLTYYLTSIPLSVTEYLSLIVGGFLVIAGLIELKDFYWYGRGFSLQIPHFFSERIKEYAKRLTIPGVMFLGAFVAGVELPCTGAPYLAIITILSQNFNFQALLLLVLYNLIFILPLVVILSLVLGGMELKHVTNWKQANKHYMRLGAGVLLVALGWLLMLISNGTINFG